MAQCKEWNDTVYDMSIAVNLRPSASRHDQPDLFAELLAEIGLDPSKLDARDHRDHDHGAGTVGCGDRATRRARCAPVDRRLRYRYSSLSHLQRLPVQEIKVDRSFVMTMGANESDAAIVKSIVDLGHNLGLKVVAEGVEDRVSWDLLRGSAATSRRVTSMSRPIPADAFNEWLQGWGAPADRAHHPTRAGGHGDRSVALKRRRAERIGRSPGCVAPRP